MKSEHKPQIAQMAQIKKGSFHICEICVICGCFSVKLGV